MRSSSETVLVVGLVSSDTKEAISSGVPLMIIFIPASPPSVAAAVGRNVLG